MTRIRLLWRLLPVIFIITILAAAILFISRATRPSRPASLTPPVENATASNPARVKILVASNGLYELSAAQLQAAGLGSDPSHLQLFYRGREQPVWIEGESDALTLRFYGQASQSRYARENVYWLQAGGAPGRRMKESASAPTSDAPAARHYLAIARAEENRLYSPQVETGDRWLWVSLAAPRTQTFTVPLTAIAPGAGRLTLEVWSSTQSPQSPDHHLRVAINGQTVADETWDGQGRRTLTATIPPALSVAEGPALSVAEGAGIFVEGANTLTIEAPGDTGVAADIVAVDWIEISYPRSFVAENDRLEFDSPGGTHALTGFSGPVTVLDITDPEQPVRLAAAQQGSGAVTFNGETGHRYLAVGPKGKQSPTQLIPVSAAPDLRAPGNGADYIAIGPPDLLEPLQPLLSWRESQGLRVEAIPAQVVYDQFNDGLAEPEAIRAFISYTLQAWQPAPQYLLLVGDATYDPLGYTTRPEANRLPTFLVPTVYGGETASDVAFVQLDDTLLPRLAVGRMPAATAGQVQALVEKTLAYEQRSPAGDWRQRILAIADGQAPAFRQDAQTFLDQLPADYQGVLYQPPAGAGDAGRQVRQYIEKGNLLVSYFGHGSITQWGKDRILTADEGAALAGSHHLPVILNMTCLTGLFTHPKTSSLTEVWLWQKEGGAVAVLAPTSLTLASDQSFLSQALATTLFADPTITLGQALVRAQRQLSPAQSGTRDVMQTFLLFGDPALRLAYPAQSLD